MYTLQNFGILDVPLTPTGRIKTKHIKDFVKVRTAIDIFRQDRCKVQMTTFTTENPTGIESPEMKCVVFGLSKKFKQHKGNLEFRDLVQRMLLVEEENKKAREASADSSTTASALQAQVSTPIAK